MKQQDLHMNYLRLDYNFFARAIACLAAVLFFRTPANADDTPPRYALTARAERREAIYRQGENITFHIWLLLEDQPVEPAQVDWALSKDGLPPLRKGTVKLEHGQGKVEGKLDEPGFLQCQVTYHAPTGAVVTALGGAGVDPEQIRPSLPVPEDFDAFWSAQKQKLAAVPANPRLTPVPWKAPEVECFDLQADCIGAPISGYFARPAGAKPKSLPIILTVHGAGVSSSILSTAASFAKEGYLALDLNAHGLPNGRPPRFYMDLAAGELKDYRARGRESRETVYFLGMFLRLIRAMDVLTAQPEWDGRTLVVFGSSQGGAQALAAAGLDPRVTFFAAGVPAMCDHTGSAVGRICGWPKLVPDGPDARPDPKVREAARYYDAVNFASRIKVPGILAVGFIDTTCPPTTVYAAYNALQGSKEIFKDPVGKHAVALEGRTALRDAVRRYVDAHRVAK